ncbi:hypothetical protein DCAR_0832459 [Daucus carota subsp. sativus]|uniref:Uncharacterized protein n=1 Tax=Daucus carota subsp. sativus TaxID=79200 RepID=A0AAF1BB65_DAUCS|nr:hypothetical protein DCAR_0832459 [Daucus carota subsp. sativus]
MGCCCGGEDEGNLDPKIIMLLIVLALSVMAVCMPQPRHRVLVYRYA